METIDELQCVPGDRDRRRYPWAPALSRCGLVADAKDGVLPPNAPPLGATIETDLAEHGFALLRARWPCVLRLALRSLTSKAFERAANAFEALVRNGDPEAA